MCSPGLIGQYAVPVLEDRQVWGTSDQTRIAYMDTQDVAKITLKALKTESSCGKNFTLAGPQAYTSDEILAMCERMSNVKRPPKVCLLNCGSAPKARSALNCATIYGKRVHL